MEPGLRIWAVLKCDLGNWVLIIFEFLRFRMVGRVDMEVLVGEVKVVVVMVVLAAVTVVVEISLCYHGNELRFQVIWFYLLFFENLVGFSLMLLIVLFNGSQM